MNSESDIPGSLISTNSVKEIVSDISELSRKNSLRSTESETLKFIPDKFNFNKKSQLISENQQKLTPIPEKLFFFEDLPILEKEQFP